MCCATPFFSCSQPSPWTTGASTRSAGISIRIACSRPGVGTGRFASDCTSGRRCSGISASFGPRVALRIRRCVTCRQHHGHDQRRGLRRRGTQRSRHLAVEIAQQSQAAQQHAQQPEDGQHLHAQQHTVEHAAALGRRPGLIVQASIGSASDSGRLSSASSAAWPPPRVRCGGKCSRRSLRRPRRLSISNRRNSSTERSSGDFRLGMARGLYLPDMHVIASKPNWPRRRIFSCEPNAGTVAY